MQVVCSSCQLSFDAPDGATGLVCPICRGPLRPQADANAAAVKTAQEWSGGDLDDLIAILSAPALSARVEVLPPNSDVPAGEVHLLAGGVSDALFAGKATDDALDRLRAIPQARFRVEPRLPNPINGDLSNPGAESGTLESRALAHLMRYCEDYVITCSIEVWRGNENARVEYRRGEINGVTVGGIDAPERLAEVMKWSSGNYRLIVPPFHLPAAAPKRAQSTAGTPAPVPAPAPSAQAARQMSATKTMFGIPVSEVTKAREAASGARPASGASPAHASAPASVVSKTIISTPSPAPIAAPVPAPVQASAAPSARPAAPAGAAPASSATKTIFGVPAPSAPDGYVPVAMEAPRAAAPVGRSSAASAEREPATTTSGRTDDRKHGARKVSVPAPEISPAPAASPPVAVARTEATEPVKRASAAGTPAAITRHETTEPVKRMPPSNAVDRPRSAGGPVLSWALVGVFFGAVFLAVYYFVGQLGH